MNILTIREDIEQVAQEPHRTSQPGRLLKPGADPAPVEVVNADNALAFAGADFGDPAYLLRHTGFFDLGPDTYLDLGLSAAVGPNDPEGETETSSCPASISFR